MLYELCDAAYDGDLERVQALIDDGGNVNEADRFGQTPLIWACRKGKIEIAKRLIEKGADVNQADDKTLIEEKAKENSSAGAGELLQRMSIFQPVQNSTNDDGSKPENTSLASCSRGHA